ncbi:oxidoreductase [Lactobacillus selangorensis]|uniref:Oxidoreductase n=1 Tax=Lactobacillus selangorensis TaxID=81857 RepID=A0A0R2FKA2_9LACO|nr:aldo/keto reductase [Lactobacillus selangorensis]KRN28686.1 oxidoreductase [Lactobacillus selangorensis]KRN32903.1 oxidoreductase [Lactobacillus selangorensis]
MTNVNTPKFKLNDGTEIPAIGFGTYLIPNDGTTYRAVSDALSVGYRHLDTAAVYMNEAEVGQAVRESGIPRDQIWVTSKLWLQDYGYEAAKKGIDRSLQVMGLNYLDLYLLHQPYGDVVGAWKALEEAKKAGKIRSIGVSNMTPKYWQEYIPQFETTPSVDQVQFNPYFQQKDLRKLLAADDVKLEAWAPLGQGNQDLFAEPIIQDLAKKYQKDAGQVILRFENQEGIIVFPKSVHPARIKSNLDIFDFKLTDSEMAQIRALDTGKGTYDPDAPGNEEMLLSAYDVHADD